MTAEYDQLADHTQQAETAAAWVDLLDSVVAGTVDDSDPDTVAILTDYGYDDGLPDDGLWGMLTDSVLEAVWGAGTIRLVWGTGGPHTETVIDLRDGRATTSTWTWGYADRADVRSHVPELASWYADMAPEVTV